MNNTARIQLLAASVLFAGLASGQTTETQPPSSTVAAPSALTDQVTTGFDLYNLPLTQRQGASVTFLAPENRFFPENFLLNQNI
jgi:hypothetical protein